jgi:hypothetical protein
MKSQWMDSRMDQMTESMKDEKKVQQLESRMDSCLDQWRDGMKDRLLGTEMNQLKAR